MMFIITLNPDEYDLTGGDTCFICPTEDHIENRTKLLANKYPGRTIYVFKLNKNIVVNVKYTTKVYAFNDKGELLPE